MVAIFFLRLVNGFRLVKGCRPKRPAFVHPLRNRFIAWNDARQAQDRVGIVMVQVSGESRLVPLPGKNVSPPDRAVNQEDSGRVDHFGPRQYSALTMRNHANAISVVRVMRNGR
jgi:hypothetical protein